MAHKSMNTRDHSSKKNEGARAKWMVDKKVGRPKQSFDPATKTYAKTFPSGVKV